MISTDGKTGLCIVSVCVNLEAIFKANNIDRGIIDLTGTVATMVLSLWGYPILSLMLSCITESVNSENYVEVTIISGIKNGME